MQMPMCLLPVVMCLCAGSGLQEKVRCKKSNSQSKLASSVVHKVSHLKQKVKSKGLPAGIGTFHRKEPSPATRIQKKLSRPKSSKPTPSAKYPQQDLASLEAKPSTGSAEAGTDWGSKSLGCHGPVGDGRM